MRINAIPLKFLYNEIFLVKSFMQLLNLFLKLENNRTMHSLVMKYAL